MKGLIVREPWISRILSGEKTWELRTLPTKMRGRIGLIRAGSKLILGTADLSDVVPMWDVNHAMKYQDFHLVPRRGLYEYFSGRRAMYGWVLENPKVLSKPVPYIHPKGAIIWVSIPDIIAAA